MTARTRNNAYESETVDDVKRLLDWLYARELTWVVIILTCFVGLIETLPEITYYGNSLSQKILTSIMAFIGLTLVAGLAFSIDRFARLSNAEGPLEMKLPKPMRKRLHNTVGPQARVIFETDAQGNILGFKKWFVPVVNGLLLITWVTVIILKIFYF